MYGIRHLLNRLKTSTVWKRIYLSILIHLACEGREGRLHTGALGASGAALYVVETMLRPLIEALIVSSKGVVLNRKLICNYKNHDKGQRANSTVSPDIFLSSGISE